MKVDGKHGVVCGCAASGAILGPYRMPSAGAVSGRVGRTG